MAKFTNLETAREYVRGGWYFDKGMPTVNEHIKSLDHQSIQKILLSLIAEQLLNLNGTVNSFPGCRILAELRSISKELKKLNKTIAPRTRKVLSARPRANRLAGRN